MTIAPPPSAAASAPSAAPSSPATPAPAATIPAPATRYAARGMVASLSPEAAAAGLRVLMEGGNAFDAAITTALVEGLTLPGSCGLGGDMFAVLYDARTRSLHAINGSGVAAGAASREYYVSRGHTTMPLYGVHSASVPGAPDAYWTLHQRFGSRPWADLVAPAIRGAEEGLAVSPAFARGLGGAHRKISQHTPAQSVARFFPEGAPTPGTLFRRPALGRSLRAFAEHGPEPFYRGQIAEEIVRAAREAGGLFSMEDFAGHESEVYRPISVKYRDVEVHATAPVSQGLILLEHLSLLEGFDLAATGFGTAETLHALVETKKLAFADRLRYAGDPRFVDVPLDRLLSKEFAARRRKAVDPDRAAGQVAGALPEQLRGDTSYFCVADGDGNAISFIHSLSAGYGSGFVAGETGILLNNRAGRGFTLEDGHPNVIQGGKRTMHTLQCYAITRGGELYAVGGTPGGDQQPQWNAQVITNLVDFGMDPQQAVNAPRWYSFPGTDPEHVGKPFDLHLETRFGADVAAALAGKGHQIVEHGEWGTPGRVQLITRLPNGLLAGATDPRGAGVALGF